MRRQKLIIMINKIFLSVLCVLFISLNINAQETNAPKFGKGLFNLKGKDSTWTMKVGMRFQTLATFGWDVNGGHSPKRPSPTQSGAHSTPSLNSRRRSLTAVIRTNHESIA